MSNYTKTTNFAAKDALLTGDPNKVIYGTAIDTEYNNIQTAVNTKYDSASLASQAQAEAGTSDAVLMTPLKVQQWGNLNAGIVSDLRTLADPNADRILFWDDSEGTAAFLTIGSGLSVTGGTTLVASAAGFVSDTRAINTGTGLTGGGDLSADRTISLSHLGIQSLTAPGIDAAIVWDDSAGTAVFASFSEGVQNTATNVIKLNLSALTAITAVDGSADYAVVLDATDSVHKKVLVSDLIGATAGIPVTKRVTTNETRTSTTTATTSTALSGWTLTAGAYYKVEGHLRFECSSAAVDAKIRFDTSTAVLNGQISLLGIHGSTLASTYNVQVSTTGTEGWVAVDGGSSLPAAATISGQIIAGGADATLNMLWAQLASSATPQTLMAGSWMTVTRIS